MSTKKAANAKTMSEIDIKLGLSKGESFETLISEGADPMMLLSIMKAENEKLASKVKAAPKPSMKVSDKGAISIYGFGRFPVTLYPEQVEKFFTMQDEVRAFITEHKVELEAKQAFAKTEEGKAAAAVKAAAWKAKAKV